MRVLKTTAGATLASMLMVTAAAADDIQWSVVNNFALLAGRDSQERFASDLKVHLACMKQRFSPGQCDNRRSTFGLTQKPYSVRFDAKTLQYDPNLLHPNDGGGPDTVMVELDAQGARDDQRCDWTIGGRTQKGAPCRGMKSAVKLGEDVEVTVDPRGRGNSAKTIVNVKRFVVATFGDSYMSGEGNPHMRSRVDPVQAENWLEPRCHRSLMTASAQAALRHAQINPQAYVAYYNFACSGSTGEVGVLGAYSGVISSRQLDNLRGPDDNAVHFRGDKLPAQIDQAKAALCPRGAACVAPDVVFLSIGINSLRFTDTVTALAKSTCDGACRRKLDETVSKGLAALAGDGDGSLLKVYETIARTLKPKQALVLEYPDPTRNDKGAFCDANALFPTISTFSFGSLSIGRIDAAENSWAAERILAPLNETIEKAVARMEGWRFVAGPMEATRKHGYCADKTFFHSGQAAKGTSGTMHPNVVGHDAVAGFMTAAMKAGRRE